MQTIILVVHLLIALALVGVVLLQKSEGGLGGLGGGGPSGGSMGGLLGGRAAANLLTRATGILAGSFFLTSIGLAILAGGNDGPVSIIQEEAAPVQQEPMRPHQPAVPTGE
ncbi:MAG: preprotein translocase subunit SecG [Alphaproteobacteria bacterium]|jgi:preprotein translocase subunit SecG